MLEITDKKFLGLHRLLRENGSENFCCITVVENKKDVSWEQALGLGWNRRGGICEDRAHELVGLEELSVAHTVHLNPSVKADGLSSQ